MKFWSQLTLVLSLILLMLVSVEAKRVTSFEKRPACEASGGVWRQYGNACADGCLVKFDKFRMCAQALTYACDCLKDKCFDGQRCVGLEGYKVEYEAIKNKEKTLLNNLKEARQGEYSENRQRIMQRLFGAPPEANNQVQNLDAVKNQQQTPSNNNLTPKKKEGFSPINSIRQNPNVHGGGAFEVPAFFAKSQEDAKKSLDEKDKENDDSKEGDNSKKFMVLPNIPLPTL